jgi:phosphoribosylamine--glycine ligase
MGEQKAVYVVAAVPGYPTVPETGTVITGLEKWIANHHGFFAGVQKNPQGQWLTSGGRVLGALGIGETIAEARRQAFDYLLEISFEGMQIRSGVGAEWV